MKVYEFDKNFLIRLSECENILNCKDTPVPASQVRSEWAFHIELQIEPAGWDAVWKIPRVTCEDLKIKYPTFVYGNVINVMFKELKADFKVLAVQDDDIQLPDIQYVSLEELWPTIQQENTELNVEQTADCIDQLRFFYNNIWLPWDNDYDDNIDWAKKHLDSRIRFAYDLKTNVKAPLANHIQMLLTESRYLQKRREHLELNLSDDENDMDSDIEDNKIKNLNETPNKIQITELMLLHLRLITIKNEVELFENPETRDLFAEIKFPDLNLNLQQINGDGISADNVENNYSVFIVTKQNNLQDEIQYLEEIKKIVGDKKIVQFSSSLQECFPKCNPFDEIYISIGYHTLEFLEYLNIKGKICAVIPKERQFYYRNIVNDKIDNLNKCKIIDDKMDAIIRTHNNDSILLLNHADNFNAKNITFDCRNARTGLIIRKGCVTIENCKFLGNANSKSNVGIVVSAGTTLKLNNCLISDFGVGINLHANSTVIIENTIITNCLNGIELTDNCSLQLSHANSISLNEWGISLGTVYLENRKIYEDCIQLNSDETLINEIRSIIREGCCSFKDNSHGNIHLFNNNEFLIKVLSEEDVANNYETN